MYFLVSSSSPIHSSVQYVENLSRGLSSTTTDLFDRCELKLISDRFMSSSLMLLSTSYSLWLSFSSSILYIISCWIVLSFIAVIKLVSLGLIVLSEPSMTYILGNAKLLLFLFAFKYSANSSLSGSSLSLNSNDWLFIFMLKLNKL